MYYYILYYSYACSTIFEFNIFGSFCYHDHDTDGRCCQRLFRSDEQFKFVTLQYICAEVFLYLYLYICMVNVYLQLYLKFQGFWDYYGSIIKNIVIWLIHSLRNKKSLIYSLQIIPIMLGMADVLIYSK